MNNLTKNCYCRDAVLSTFPSLYSSPQRAGWCSVNELQTRPNDSSVLSCRRRFVHAFTKCQEPCCSAFSEEAVRLRGPGGVCRFSPIFSQSVQTLSDVASVRNRCVRFAGSVSWGKRSVSHLFVLPTTFTGNCRNVARPLLSGFFLRQGWNVRIVDDDEINNLAPLCLGFRFLWIWCRRNENCLYGWIDSSWKTHWTIFRSSQCSTTGVTKAVVCAILYVGWCI